MATAEILDRQEQQKTNLLDTNQRIRFTDKRNTKKYVIQLNRKFHLLVFLLLSWKSVYCSYEIVNIR